MSEELLVLVHAAATLGMAGVIWFVQLVHYPLFLHVGNDRFVGYARQHVRRTTWVVAPLMLTEVTSAVWLLARNDGANATLYQIGAAILFGIWLSTALLQVPCHRRLELGFDLAAARRLVRTNWLRTAGWSARAGIAVFTVSGSCL